MTAVCLPEPDALNASMWKSSLKRLPAHTRSISVALGLGLGLAASPAAQADTVMVLGDSLSAGYGIELSQGWVSLLQQRLNTDPAFARGRPHRVINASASGETSSGGLARLPRLLSQHRPDVLILELGGNDGLRGQPPAQLAQNLSRMVQLGQAQGSKVVLVGMRIPPNYGRAYTEAFAQVYPRVATQYHLPLVPFLLHQVAGQASLMQADGIHPNARAQPIMLRQVLPVLQQHWRAATSPQRSTPPAAASPARH